MAMSSCPAPAASGCSRPTAAASVTIVTPRHVHNMAWGGTDRQTLFLCARDRLYRMRLMIPGSGAPPRS